MNLNQAINKYTKTIGLLNYAMAIIVAFTAAFPSKIFNIAWTIWLLTWALEGRFLQKSNFSFNKSQYPVILLAFFYIWQVVSILWAKNADTSISMLQRQLSFLLIIPVALFGFNKFYKTKTILYSVLAGALVSLIAYSMVLFYLGNYNYFTSGGKAESWTGFSVAPFHAWMSFIKHRLYYCTVLVLAIISAFSLRKNLQEKFGKLIGWMMIIGSSALLLGMIILSESRSTILVLFVLAAINILYLFKPKYRVFVIALITALSTTTLILVIKYHPRMNNFAASDFNILKTGKTDKDPNLVEARLFIWHAAFNSMDEYFWFGKGVGNSTGFLVDKYEKLNYPKIFTEREYGAHNQYLIALIDIGIFGCVFLILYFMIFHLFFEGRARLFAMNFSILTGINLLTEGMLGRVDGIIILCFFTLLCIRMQKEEHEKQKSLVQNQNL